MKVLIAVSGTGGHVYPGIALAEELTDRRSELSVVFCAARGKPGIDWIESAGFPVRTVPLRGFSRTPSLSWLVFPFALVAGCLGALTLVAGERPDLVIGTGGYVSGPFVASAWLLRVPAVVLEQNTIPGVATRLGARLAREIHVADAGAAERLGNRANVHVSGNPVRRSVEEGDAAAFRREHDLDGRPLVLVLGGSQGARALTGAAIAAARELAGRDDVQMLVQAGRRGMDAARELASGAPDWLRVVPFVTEMGHAYAAASLVVARAGAMTLAELAATGRPAILVPYPHAAGDHQTANARRWEAAGAARVLPQDDLTGGALAGEIARILDDAESRERMRESARSIEGARARETIASACEAYLG